ncbi:hypothetical protein REPUB_Repub13aG0160400 [Reevesia pubescens]
MKNLGFLCSYSTCTISVFIYISMLMCSNVVVLVYAEGFEFESLLQLPRSGSSRIRPRAKRVLSVGDFGAKGDGHHDDTKAFVNAWKIACSSPVRTRILIPAGYTYLVHPVELGGPCRSKITLMALTFHKCKNLKVHNLMVVNSQQMHIAFTSCLRVTVSNLKVLAPATSPNTDGIHISASRGVEVKNSIVRTGDDCISIVSNSSRVKIRNIACGPGHGISIGSLGKSNSWAQVHNVLVDGAFISNTENGVRIKTWQGGSGYAANMKFQNVLMENVSYPIIIDQYYCDSDLPCANQTLAVKVDNISFVNIKGTSATEEAIRFGCSDSLPCEGLYLEDIQLVSYTGAITKSFCWEAYGSSSGLVQPAPCLTCTDGFIKQNVPSGLAVDSF